MSWSIITRWPGGVSISVDPRYLRRIFIQAAEKKRETPGCVLRWREPGDVRFSVASDLMNGSEMGKFQHVLLFVGSPAQAAKDLSRTGQELFCFLFLLSGGWVWTLWISGTFFSPLIWPSDLQPDGAGWEDQRRESSTVEEGERIWVWIRSRVPALAQPQPAAQFPSSASLRRRRTRQ